MDEKDKRIQDLARTNLQLLADLHAIKECFTCSHYGEMAEHCEQYPLGYSCRDFDYEWRGVKASEEWHEEQENIRQAVARVKALADKEEDIFEGVFRNEKDTDRKG